METCSFNESANWKLVFEEDYQAELVNPEPKYVFVPIPEQLIILNLESPTVVIEASSTDTGGRAWLATAIRIIEVPDSPFESGNISDRSRRLYRDRATLLDFPDYQEQYSFRLLPKYYVAQLSIKIWEHICPPAT